MSQTLDEVFSCDCGQKFCYFRQTGKCHYFFCPNPECRNCFYLFNDQIDDKISDQHTVRFGTGKLSNFQHKKALKRVGRTKGELK